MDQIYIMILAVHSIIKHTWSCIIDFNFTGGGGGVGTLNDTGTDREQILIPSHREFKKSPLISTKTYTMMRRIIHLPQGSTELKLATCLLIT